MVNYRAFSEKHIKKIKVIIEFLKRADISRVKFIKTSAGGFTWSQTNCYGRGDNRTHIAFDKVYLQKRKSE